MARSAAVSTVKGSVARRLGTSGRSGGGGKPSLTSLNSQSGRVKRSMSASTPSGTAGKTNIPAKRKAKAGKI